MAQLDWSIDFEPGELTDAVLAVFDFDRKYEEQDKFEDYYDRKLKRLCAENGIQFGGSKGPEERAKIEKLSKRAEVYALKVLISEAYGDDEAFNESVINMFSSGGIHTSDEQIVLIAALTKPFADEYAAEKASEEDEEYEAARATDRYDLGSWAY